MSLRDDAMQAHPGVTWLDPNDADGIATYLRSKGWLSERETIVAVERPGDGNMNLTLRVRTGDRSLVLKQARPWVEKYDEIPAPWERSASERWFYERIAKIPIVVAMMPRLIGFDTNSRVLVLEDLGSGGDCTKIYGDAQLRESEIQQLATYLRAL